MRVKIFRRFGGEAMVMDAAVVIVEGHDGQPLAIAADCGNGGVGADVLREDNVAEFNNMLRCLGIDKTVIVDKLGSLPPSETSRLPQL